MDWLEWYNTLNKPSWTPAPGVIGTIWQILYPMIAISFGFVFVQVIRKRLPIAIALPFILNLVFNLAFTPIQFMMRNLTLASIDILLVWGTLVWCIVAIWPYYRWVSLAQIPYLVWVSIATVLQLNINYHN